MDLRTRKTLRALRDSFVALRREKSVERITVRELCERAEVSKATFYLHFHSIYDLLEDLQREAVRSIVDQIEDPRALFDRPAEATRQLLELFKAHHGEVDTLFSGSQAHALAEGLAAEIRERLCAAQPELAGNLRADVLVTYLVEGSYQAFMRLGSSADPEETRQVIDAIGDANEAVAAVMKTA